MTKTWAEWDEYFKELPLETLNKIVDAFETLKRAEMFWEEYKWTGLPTLLVSARNILETREVTEVTIEGQILHGALERGDKTILNLADDVWGDSFYDRLLNAIEEMSEEDKKKLYAKYTGDKG